MCYVFLAVADPSGSKKDKDAAVSQVDPCPRNHSSENPEKLQVKDSHTVLVLFMERKALVGVFRAFPCSLHV